MCESRFVRKAFPTDPPALAKALVDKAGLSPSYASELANNRRWPSLRMAVRLKRSLGIPPEFWTTRGEPTRPSEAA
jgi:plasmid maintenance system antidote protein VapI